MRHSLLYRRARSQLIWWREMLRPRPPMPPPIPLPDPPLEMLGPILERIDADIQAATMLREK